MVEFIKKQQTIDENKLNQFSSELKVSKQCANLLCLRGYDNIEDAREFLNPDISMILDPFLFPQMQDAVDCIVEYIHSGQKICIYSDYDVDGVSGATILSLFLKSVYANYIVYIPTRSKDGYGLNNKAIEYLKEQQVELIITVDCGISNYKEVEFANSLGIEVIVTDHHQMPEILPSCAAIINPQQTQYPFKHLCGAGVALKLVYALAGIEEAQKYLDIAAIATVADIVEISGENRAIVALGLKKINSNECNIGLAQLCTVSGYNARNVDVSAIGFGIGPRINAAGRTDDARLSYELFMQDDVAAAQRIAKTLDKKNQERQMIELTIMQQAQEKIENGEIDLVDQFAIVLQDERWNAGVIGICASKLAEKYNKPIILFAQKDGLLTGSGRSIAGINLFEVLSSMYELFERYGGHVMAAGMSIKIENFNIFKDRFNSAVKEILKVENPKIIEYDVECEPNELNIKLIKDINRLAPFGAGNPEPNFLISKVSPVLPRLLGKDKSHLKFSLNSQVEVLAFKKAELLSKVSSCNIDMVCNLNINTWNNKQTPQCIVRSLRTDNNIGNYIGKNIWKFYDAFYEQIRYNNIINDKIVDMNLEETFKDEVCEHIYSWQKENLRGMLILCFTPKGAKDCANYLLEKDIINRFEFTIADFNEQCAYNTVLAAPYKEKIDISKYKKIIIWDRFLSDSFENWLKELISFYDDKELLICNENVNEFISGALFDRNEIVPVFKRMMAQSFKLTQFLNIEGYLDSFGNLSSEEKCKYIYCLKLFEELKFVEIKQSNELLNIRFNKTNEKKDIEQSLIYNNIKRCLK